MEGKALKAALYVRVSTEEQALHGLSVEAQTTALDAWSKKEKCKVVDHYIDAGISARKKAISRPGLQRLLDDVRAGKIDLIVFTKLDRWFRNIAEYYKVQEVLDDHDVAWKAIHEDYDTTTASGRLKVNIMLSVAQDEADRTSERIKAVFVGKKERNEPVSGHVPTGYCIDGKTIIKDEALAPAIRAYFDFYLKTGSITKAIDYVSATYNLNLKYQLASTLLSKSAYCGDFNGIECPAYISQDEHERIIATRRRVARKTTNNRTYLFTGLLICGSCGARMGARAHKYKSVEFPEYNCAGHYQNKGCQNRTNIRESSIEKYLLDTVDSSLNRLVANTSCIDESEIIDHTSEISSLKRKLSRLKDLYVNDLIDLESYKKDYESMTAKIVSLQSENPKKRPNCTELKRVFCTGWKSLYGELSRDEKRVFWRMAINEIRIYEDRHIEFSFSNF